MIGSSHKATQRIAATVITIALAFSVAAFIASGVSHARPSPGAPLNATVCKGINGVWASYTCTIPETNSGVASSSFKVGTGITLDIRGNLTINAGVTVTNVGTIIVENEGGLAPGPYHDWETGLLVLGTLDNSGLITVDNAFDVALNKATEGITVSVSVSDAGVTDPSPLVATPGALTNSGTVTITNRARTRGITNYGTISNSPSGTITVANTGTSSVGIYNKRAGVPGFLVNGTLTNAGMMAISSSGDSNYGAQFGYGIYNQGIFTVSAPGVFTINPSPADDDARGLFNGGSFTNFATFTNDRGFIPPVPDGGGDLDPESFNWGSYNVGTMVNYGTTNATGTFDNKLIMVNNGMITSYGIFYDETNGMAMINYGTFYNYGQIGGGTNKGICVDEQSVTPPGTGC